MTALIIITLLMIALASSIVLNWRLKIRLKVQQGRYQQLYEQTETVATEVNPVKSWDNRKSEPMTYDVDDYRDLTSAQRQKVGGRS